MQPLKLCTPNKVEDNIYAGDTWGGFTFRAFDQGEVTLSLPKLISARLQFRNTQRRFVYELNTETPSEDGLPVGFPNNSTGCITISDLPLWEISVNAQPLPMGAGVYLWELEIVDALNVKRSILTGKVTICQDLTQ